MTSTRTLPLWKFGRRRTLGLLVGAALFFTAQLAAAGSYLTSASLLLEAARLERDRVRQHSDDRELMKLVHATAKARVDAAHDLIVPKSVAGAHPHLLLMLENCERAYAAASSGHSEKFVEHIERARSEDSTFRALLRELGYTLP
ncbi:MAG: hypothetical protein EXR75_02635 [Myxococcales bacterium]|nr:hypothetical protein [Myxococcales bacterium]